MPVYCFKLKESQRKIEVAMSVKELMRRKIADGSFRLDEGIGVRDYEAEHKGDGGGAGGATGDRAWPILCDASGVHPSQIREAKEAAARAGVPTDFAPDGRAELRSTQHRKAYLKHLGMHDRASYG